MMYFPVRRIINDRMLPTPILSTYQADVILFSAPNIKLIK